MNDKINNQFFKRGNIHDNNKNKIYESRLNYSLNLRKNKIFKKIMQKRNNLNFKNEKCLNLCINIDLLNLNIYKNEINKFNHLIIDDDKYKYLINSIVNNIHIEIFQTDFLFFNNCNNLCHKTSDFIKFCLKNLYDILNSLDKLEYNTKILIIIYLTFNSLVINNSYNIVLKNVFVLIIFKIFPKEFKISYKFFRQNLMKSLVL